MRTRHVLVIGWLLAGIFWTAYTCDVQAMNPIRQRCMPELLRFFTAMDQTSHPHLCFTLDDYLDCVFTNYPECVNIFYDAMVARKYELRSCDSRYIVLSPSIPHWRRGSN